MSASNNVSQSFSQAVQETPQNTGISQIRLNFEESLNHTDLEISIEQSMKNAQNESHQKRIQSLRKELDHLKSTEWKYEYDKDDDEYDREMYLAEELLQLEKVTQEEEIENDKHSPRNPVPNDVVCFQRTGKITYISDNEYVLIDGCLYFELSACSIQLNLNDKVLYLAYKDENDSIKVVRILVNEGPYWDDIEDIEEDCYKVIEHVIVGQVNCREERFVYMKESDLKFSLDEVEATFVPIEGDWLELKCSMQWDEEKPSDISAAQVIQVISLRPLRSKITSSVVTAWDGVSGSLDWKIYFSRHALPNGSDVHPGSKVMVEAIESSQGSCTWRVLKMIILEHAKSKQEERPNQPNQMEDEDEAISLAVEKEHKIDMTYPLKFEEIDFHQSSDILLNITNSSNEYYVLNKWIVPGKMRESQINIKPFLSKPRKLFPNQTFTLTITCNPKVLGRIKEKIIVFFKGFKLTRLIDINVVDKSDVRNGITVDHIGSRTEKDKIEILRNLRKNGEQVLIPGVRLVKPPAFVPVRLGSFNIPDKVWSAVLGDSEQAAYSSDFVRMIEMIQSKLPCLRTNLTVYNYTSRWHTLLYMEEIQNNISMRVYDLPKAFLIRCQEYLGIEIVGLSERRPSLIKGDRVIVKDVFDTNSPNYEGYIHDIRGDLVLIKFSPQFHQIYTGTDVSVEFHFSRSTYRRAHQAIELATSHLGADILFPSRITLAEPQLPNDVLDSINWHNKKLNDGQKAAIKNILSGQSRPLPYVIFGPPGTGKTITVIEVILQILTLLPDSRILVATPSNSASNVITERLIQYKDVSSSIIRLIANYLIDSENIPEAIKPFCATLDIAREDTAKSKYEVNKFGINISCRTSFIGRHRVTIGTCYCLGQLAQMGLPKGHFTHVIVDEAGQTTEPEIMIPLTFIDKTNGQIILAGDPLQLGPVVMSKYCQQFGMDESYLSRLQETFPYQRDFDAFKDGYNNKVITQLTDNYRSLEEVLKLPSVMFYDSSLVARIERRQDWIEHLQGVVASLFDLPMDSGGGVFVYGIRGVNARAEDSPSWFNPQEASMVALTACKLYKKNVSVDDIGVIAPYIAQIKHLRLLFDAMGLPQPKIGTVEEFQGQEKPIILISTVRSTESYLQEDLKHTLGFVQNPKRLNVGITRAQVAVILFCNPHLLSMDVLWKKVVEEAVVKEKYVGCDLPSCLRSDGVS